MGIGRSLTEHGKLRVDLFPDDAQFIPEPAYRQRLKHVAYDIVLDGLLGVLEVVVAAEEGYVGHGPHLPHLPGQLNTGDEGYPDIGQQQVRLRPGVPAAHPVWGGVRRQLPAV